jgi:hypothetical protein
VKTTVNRGLPYYSGADGRHLDVDITAKDGLTNNNENTYAELDTKSAIWNSKIKRITGTHPCGEDRGTINVPISGTTFEYSAKHNGRTLNLSRRGSSETVVRERGTTLSHINETTYVSKNKSRFTHSSQTYNLPYNINQQRIKSSVTKINAEGISETKQTIYNYRTANPRGVTNGFTGKNSQYINDIKPASAGEGLTIGRTLNIQNGNLREIAYTKYPDQKLSSWQLLPTDSDFTEGGATVTSMMCCGYSDYTTLTSSSTYKQNGEQSTVEYTQTGTTQRTTSMIGRTTVDDFRWAYETHANAGVINGLRTRVTGFNLAADSPFHSFIVFGKDEYAKLNEKHLSQTFDGTLCKEINCKTEQAKAVQLVNKKMFANDHKYPTLKQTIKQVLAYVTTFKQPTTYTRANGNDRVTAVYHKVTVGACGYVFQDKAFRKSFGPCESKIAVNQIRINNANAVWFSLEGGECKGIEAEKLSYAQVVARYKTYKSEDYTVTETTDKSFIRYSGTIFTGTGTKTYTYQTRQSPTVALPLEYGRQAVHEFETISTKTIKVEKTTTTRAQNALPEVPYGITYVTMNEIVGQSYIQEHCWSQPTYVVKTSVNTNEGYKGATSFSDYCAELKNLQKKLKYYDQINPAMSGGKRLAPGGVPYTYIPYIMASKSTLIHRCGAKVAANTFKQVEILNEAKPYVMSFNIGNDLSSSLRFDEGLIETKTTSYKGVGHFIEKVRWLGLTHVTYSGEIKRSYTLSGAKEVKRTIQQLSLSGSGKASAVRIVSYNSCGVSWRVDPYTTHYDTSSARFVAGRKTGEASSTTNAGVGYEHQRRFRDLKFNYNYVSEAYLHANTAIIDRVNRQYALTVWEPKIDMHHHWQDNADYGVGKEFFTNFANTNFIPNALGGANYGGIDNHIDHIHPKETNAGFRYKKRVGNQAVLANVDKPYLVYSSSYSFTAVTLVDGETYETVQSRIMESTGGNIPIFTYTANSLTEFTENIGFTAFVPTRTDSTNLDNSAKMYAVGELNSFSDTEFRTYTQTKPTVTEGASKTEETTITASLFTYAKAVLDHYTVGTKLQGGVKGELFDLGLERNSGIALSHSFYQSAYENRHLLPLGGNPLPIRRLYAIGGRHYNGRERSATILSPFRNAEVEMYYTEYNNGNSRTVKNVHKFDFSFTTAGTHVSHIAAKKALEYNTVDKQNAVQLFGGIDREYLGGNPENLLEAHNACLVAIPHMPEIRLGTEQYIAQDARQVSFGKLDSEKGEVCPNNDER